MIRIHAPERPVGRSRLLAFLLCILKQPGKYKVTASIAALSGDALAVVEVAGGTVELKPSATGSWDKFSEIEAGTIEISKTGEQTVKVRPRDAQTWKPINLRWVKLSHVGS